MPFSSPTARTAPGKACVRTPSSRMFLQICIASIFYCRAMKEVDVQIRRAKGLEDYQAVLELEKRVWGYTETDDLAAVPILMIANRFGGSVLIARESSGRFVGFSM